jgi:hypothetical protein
MRDTRDLVDLFQRLGAPNPAGWARSEINEGIPQLERFLFLRQAWRKVLEDKSINWIEEELNTPVDGPGGGIVDALRSLLDLEIDRVALTTIVRTMQWRLLFDFCYLLGDPALDEEGTEHISWGLFQTNEDGEPLKPIAGLHESVLETDPTGREMMDE